MTFCGFGISNHPVRRRTLPAAGWRTIARTLLHGLALTCLIVSMGAFAQSTSPIAPASSGTAAECANAVASDTVNADIEQFRCLPAREQAASLRTRIENHSILSLTDDQILALMDAMKPEAFVEYAKSDMIAEDAYEYSMFRQERISGRWPERPDHMLIRYQHSPRKVYAKWLPDGAHAGQEILYDETTDPKSMFGHLGGRLRLVSGKVAVSEKPGRIELMNAHGTRLLAWTWTAPSGPPAHYAPRVRLLFDLQHTWPCGEAAWDEQGGLLELIRFEDVVPRQWSESIFDRGNPEYGFR
jgi:hypothetical protein